MSEGLLERFGADILQRLERGPVEVTAAHRERGPIKLTLTLEVGGEVWASWLLACDPMAAAAARSIAAGECGRHKCAQDHTSTLTTQHSQDAKERMSLDIPGACAAIAAARRVSLLTIHGDSDSVIPPRDAALFAEAVPGSGLLIVEGGDHNFTGAGARERMVAAAVEFFAAAE